MSAAALADLHLQGDTPAAVQAAIDAAAIERQAAEGQLAGLRAGRATALLDPKAARQITSLEAEIRGVELQIERLDAVAPQLAAKLRQAEAMAERAAVNRQVELAGEAIDRFKRELEGYADHAAAIVAICRLNREALAAAGHAQRLARRVGNAPAFDIPGGVGGLAFHEIVTLPWWPGTGMLWGTTPAKENSSIYQKVR